MNPVLQAALGSLSNSISTVLHIGADDVDLPGGYAALGAQRVILVNGDPDICGELLDADQAATRIEVLERVVAPVAGTCEWQAYSPRAFSGLLAAQGLQQLYPRLALTARREVEAVTLEALMLELEIVRQLGRANLLVLDTPGVEAALLRSLPASLLVLFQWVVVKGASPGMYESADAPALAAAMLEDRHYGRVDRGSTTDSLWPLTLMRLDRAGHEVQALTEKTVELDAELARYRAQEQREADQCSAELARLEQLCASQATTLAAWESGAKQHALLDRRRNEQIEAVVQAKAGLESELINQRVLNKHLESSARIHKDHAAALERRVGELEQALQQRSTTLDAVQAKLEHVTTTSGALAEEKPGLTARLEQQQQRIGELEKQLAEKQSKADQSAEQRRVLEEALWSADGQLALLKDLLRPAGSS